MFSISINGYFYFQSELASIHSPDEERFIITKIRESREYSASAIYWLGGQRDNTYRWNWIDDSSMTYAGKSLPFFVIPVLFINFLLS